MDDTLVPLAVARRLEAIDEQDFRRSRDGYRPPVGPLDAVRTRTITRQFGRDGFVVAADIKGVFDPLEQAGLRRMVAERIADKALLRLIQTWRKAGVLDTDGHVLPPATGTPQGGLVSPIVANVYVHDALDLWCEKVVKPRGKGEAGLIRDADDCVCAFEDHGDATAFDPALGDRRGTFKLALATEQTRRIVCPRSQTQPSVECLGLELRWGKDRSGQAHLPRRSSRQTLQKSLANVTEWCRPSRHVRLRLRFERLNAKLQGCYNDAGVQGNVRRLEACYHRARHLLMTWLNRRSQRRRCTWRGFNAVRVHCHVPRPPITERPRARAAATQAYAFCGSESC